MQGFLILAINVQFLATNSHQKTIESINFEFKRWICSTIASNDSVLAGSGESATRPSKGLAEERSLPVAGGERWVGLGERSGFAAQCLHQALHCNLEHWSLCVTLEKETPPEKKFSFV